MTTPLDQNASRRHVLRTLALAWPMILSRVGIVAMFAADVVVLGRAGATELADYVLGQAVNDSLGRHDHRPADGRPRAGRP
jgi:Na+-driven multidrug efflux pump